MKGQYKYMKKFIVSSSSEPLRIDNVSSRTVTYINYNVHKVEREVSISKSKYSNYEYDQLRLTKQEYSIYEKVKDLTDKQKLERITELQEYLNSTDWYAIRQAESGKKIPKSTLKNREEARIEISLLKDTSIY